MRRVVEKVIVKICSRGHKFKRSKLIPICPMCWPGRYEKKLK